MNSEKLTKDDIKKIQDEINERKTVLRPKILEDVKTARAQGDLSENFEYYAARKANRENNSRIDYTAADLVPRREDIGNYLFHSE